MLLSVFTPTHNPTYLSDVWMCLKAQAYTEWEWVVVPNGNMTKEITAYLTQLVAGDRRARIVEAPASLQGVGALKRFACDQCHGKVFVEYDHDDLITEDCLSSVAAAVTASGDASTFVYSDSVSISFTGESQAFLKEFGWEHYTWEYKNVNYKVNRHHSPTPRALCEILYAPNHVRAWTREAYRAAGGYNPNMPVGDDHDLLVRTYLAGAVFVRVPHPLYIQRFGKDNTSLRNLGQITELSRATRDRNLHKLVHTWCRRNALPMFDLGGAHNAPAGFQPIDIHLPANDPFCGDVFQVLQTAIPSNSVGCFRASDFLEHVPPHRVVELMNLLYDRLVPGGYLLTHTPAVCDNDGKVGRGAYQDPDHKSFWSSNNFWYYTDQEYAKYLNGAVKCRFQTIRVFNYYPSDYHKQNLIPYVLWDGMALKFDAVHYYPGPRKI